MKVWVLHSGCIYEGGGLNGLYETEEGARKKALEMVQLKNEQFKEWNKEKGAHGFFELYIEINHNYWSNKTDYVLVYEVEVNP